MDSLLTRLKTEFFTEHLEGLYVNVLTVLFVLIIFLGLAIFVGKVMMRLAESVGPVRGGVIILGAQIAKVLIISVGLISALGMAGVNVSALLASLGLTGFALGFAFKDILSNFLAGALILFYRPFSKGDRVAVLNVEGKVEAIDLRYTRLKSEKDHYLVPNSTLLSNVITVRGNE
ncbi:MAG: mechanosensitive ion channel family protein [Chthoniobacterales bacterium]